MDCKRRFTVMLIQRLLHPVKWKKDYIFVIIFFSRFRKTYYMYYEVNLTQGRCHVDSESTSLSRVGC